MGGAEGRAACCERTDRVPNGANRHRETRLRCGRFRPRAGVSADGLADTAPRAWHPFPKPPPRSGLRMRQGSPWTAMASPLAVHWN